MKILKVRVKGDVKDDPDGSRCKYEQEFNTYDPFCFDEQDPFVGECIRQAVENSNCIPDSIDFYGSCKVE